MAAHTTVTKQPQPVLTRAGIVTALAVLSALLVKVGAGSVSAWLDQNSDWIAGLLLSAAPIISGWLARNHVTPVVSPQDNDGNELVPSGSEAAAVPLGIDSDAASTLAELEQIFPMADAPVAA